MGNVFRRIGAFFAGLWRFSMFWRVSPIGEARVGSPLAGALMFLFLVFCVIGAVLMALGFDLGRVDAWLSSQINWIDLIAQLLFRGFLVFVLLMCIAVIVAFAFDPKELLKGWWMVLGALILGYFVSVTLLSPLDPVERLCDGVVLAPDGKP